MHNTAQQFGRKDVAWRGVIVTVATIVPMARIVRVVSIKSVTTVVAIRVVMPVVRPPTNCVFERAWRLEMVVTTSLPVT